MTEAVHEEVEATEVAQTEEGIPKAEKTFTQSELDEIIKRRLAKAEAKYQQELDSRLSEAEKLKEMTDKQKYEYEIKKREDELATLRNEIETRDMQKQVSGMLAEAGLPTTDSMLNLFKGKTADEASELVGEVTKVINDATQAKVQEALKGQAPKVGAEPVSGVSKQAFKHLSYTNLLKLHEDNPDLYQTLKG